MNRLYYGDNLDVLKQHVQAASVDLVYLDPPFNSDRNYNVIFNRHSITADDDAAQIQAFADTWVWTPVTETQYTEYVGGALPPRTADALTAFRTLLGENDAMAYLVNMAPRLVELHRVLKSTGSLYLHCDPTMSHYLKVLLDSIFEPTAFKNEIIWRRTGAHSPGRKYGPIHDVILFYTKSTKTSGYYFTPTKTPYTLEHVENRYKQQADGRFKFTSGGNVLTGPDRSEGESGQPWRGFNPSPKNRHWAIPGFVTEQMPPEFAKLGVLDKLEAAYEAGLIEIIPGRAWPEPVRYLDETSGTPVCDIWAYQPGTQGVLYGTPAGIDQDVAYLGPTSPERLDFPTQKPVGLLERIIRTSCPPDGVILDPFCGCGTTVDAAQRMGRTWIGIDVTYISIDLIRKRLQNTYGAEVEQTYEVLGIPRDKQAALALFSRSPFDFERWAVSLVNGQPNQRQVGDKGIDGVARFPLDARGTFGRVLISVKGGKQLNPSMVRDLGGTVATQKAQMGVLITNGEPTKGMIDEANHAGTYTHPHYSQAYPRIQIITINELLSGKKPTTPPTVLPYVRALRADTPADQQSLFAGE